MGMMNGDANPDDGLQQIPEEFRDKVKDLKSQVALGLRELAQVKSELTWVQEALSKSQDETRRVVDDRNKFAAGLIAIMEAIGKKGGAWSPKFDDLLRETPVSFAAEFLRSIRKRLPDRFGAILSSLNAATKG